MLRRVSVMDVQNGKATKERVIWARERFGAQVKGPIFDYPVFKARLDSGEIL